MPTIRTAAVQFAIGTDLAENLATCLRMIDEAAQVKPDLVVLPEFCNHLSWYPDLDYSYNVAVDLDGDFVQQIGAKAAEHHFYLMLNCTVRRPQNTLTGTNVLFNPSGKIIATSDKQVLMGNENNFLSKAAEVCPIIETPLGRLGMYSCMDGVIFETPRGLALRGAQILLNSLNSFAEDEASLHVPVRAAENKVFIVAANKSGSLVPPDLAAVIAERVKISPEQLHGAGESQIVAPDGTVLAKAPRTGEAVIYADIDPTLADIKTRPDGTNIFTSRRPMIYRPLAQQPAEHHHTPGADCVTIGIYQPAPDDTLETVAKIITANPDIQIFVLPELFAPPPQSTLAPNQYLATSIINDHAHTGILISRDGILLEQPQIHPVARHAAWQTTFGDHLKIIDLPFGRVALIVGEDALYPEVFRLAALQNVEFVLAPTHIAETWELTTGLLERAAENRLGIAVASRPTPAGGSAIITIDEDFTLWTPWKHRPFDGNINYPIVTRLTAPSGLLRSELHPARSANRLVSQQTDVVDGRPWWLLDALTAE